jgi:hypothetical protein
MMPEIRLELSDADVRKLDTEVDLLGFEDRGAYLRWIIGNRAAIEQGTERDQLLTEYQARVAELEGALAEREAASGREDAATAASADSARTADGATGRDDGAAARRSDESPAGSDADAVEEASAGAAGARRERATDGSGTAAASASSGDDGAGAPDREARDDPSDPVALGGNFAPERVERFEDDSLGSHANQLRGVEGERLDEFARRAVAKTRERLGREPSTGLDYRSGTRIARSSSDVRPGEDLVDLDSLDVPGRSESTCAPRREAVGAALAYLRDVDRAKKGDFVDELYAEYPAEYDTESGWWRCIKRGLKDAPVVDGGGEGSRVWTYVQPGSREGELLGGGPTRVVDPD